DKEYNKALNWAKAASRMFVVEEFGAGIWAGLPWFRDNWGRDTFIALPGTLLVSGQFGDAKAVLSNFARYQNLNRGDKEYGRIPNRVAAGDSIIYNTVDGTPWMLREALEYIRYTGDRRFAKQMYQLAVPYFDGAVANYMDSDGLLAHDAADTWMDARIGNKQPWSARGPRAVEIQALWYTALQTGAL
ncbi:MAG: amylo-alpha-1,6-glucosidase, partial [Telluria sp.]